ncbi:GSCOCG00002122001-RA-CDS, partial [Cotesia congregata]
GTEVGGTWSCCLPCAGGGGRGPPGGLGSGVGSGSGSGNPGFLGEPESKSSIIVCHSNKRQKNQKSSITSVIKSTCKRSGSNNNSGDLDDLEALDAAVEAVATGACFPGTKGSKDKSHQNSEDSNNKDGNTQHRLSPRLHDIEEEDDEECRHTKERLVFFLFIKKKLWILGHYLHGTYQKKSPTPSAGGTGSRAGWRSRRSVTTAGATGHQHHVIATVAVTAQAKMQAEQGSIGELRGYHNLRSRRHTLANVR